MVTIQNPDAYDKNNKGILDAIQTYISFLMFSGVMKEISGMKWVKPALTLSFIMLKTNQTYF